MSSMALQDCFLEPVTSDASISSLRQLITILKSCVGPKGKAKLLVTSGNYVELTSCSSTLAERLDLQNPICRYILQTMKVQPDFGLYVGTFISSLLERVWQMQNKEQLSTNSVIEAAEQIVQDCNNLLISAEFALKIDFNSAKQLMSLVRNVISCKTFLFLPEKYVDELSFNVVKAFLMSIDDNYFIINRIILKAEHGAYESNCYNGILYKIVDKEEQDSFDKMCSLKSSFGHYNILLFSIMLTFTAENEANACALNTILQILESAVESGVHIVACQKVVHDSIKLFLRRNGLILLERMGTEQTNALKDMSNATPIADLSKVTPSDIDNVKGYLTSVGVIEFNKNKYLLLENTKRTVTTLVMCTSTLARENEVKAVVKQAVDTLRSIAKDPRVVPGAGCFEVWLLLHLELAQVPEGTNNKVDTLMLNALKNAIMSASGLQYPLSYDTVYNHAWTGETLDWCTCNCGLITRNVIANEKGKWLPLDKYDIRNPLYQSKNVSYDNLSLLANGIIMDGYLLKQKALITALEVCLNLLSIGLVVYKKC